MNHRKKYLRSRLGLRLGLKLGLGLTSLACLVGPLAAEKPSKDRPNIIYLMADDQSTYSVGCYGNKDAITPNMDKLGHDGIIFDKHYATTSICMASRASVFSGMYEYKHGCNFMHGDMQKDVWEKSYPVLLRKSGYLTAFAGKFGIKVKGKGLCESDFDFWGGGPGQTKFKTAANKSMAKYAKEYPHATLSYGAFGRDFIKVAVKQEKPFCLSISFKAPHKPATPDPKFDSIYKGKVFKKPENYGREYSKHLSEQSKQGRQYSRWSVWGYDKKYDAVMALYHQQVYAIDVAVGMIRDEVEKQGIADNTVIIYTSDNGYICGSHGYGSKVLPLEESSRVPLIIYDPRSKNMGKQLRSRALTGNIDFAATILELAGLPAPSQMDGLSLLPLVADPSANIRQHMAFINVWGSTPTHCLTMLTKDWKYTYWAYDKKGMTPTEELFKTSDDPLELKNRAVNPEYQPMLEKMRKIYDQQLASFKKDAVKKYQKHGGFFDRNAASDKKPDPRLKHEK